MPDSSDNPLAPPIVSTPPNYTGRDDRIPLHAQPIASTGLADTTPRALGDRVAPREADLIGPEDPTVDPFWGT